ncbi:murein biosynthesis integral membrane protein MurJ [Caulobacter mirabilis]|uniref:Probable lipid II flippase MurJ n=2 Tax=Caulobacter mirabilis TaxID=69666 RepID=A0A2D2B3L6_9CAUL|nr:murein biosynthesis integral membrane protein MurJ [Caulobacter mirabilis]
MVFSGLTLVSRVMGLARDLFITARLGASATPAADAFNTAQSFPNLFRRIFAEGAFTAAFVPAYSKVLAKEGQDAADNLATDALATLAAATLVLTVVAQLAMPWLMLAINPGFGYATEKYKLAVVLTQISMPYLPCMAIVALLSGVLNAKGRFALSAAAPTILNAGILIAVIVPRDAVGSAYAATWGIFGAGIAQAALLWWGVRKAGAKIRPTVPRLTPEIKALIATAIPGAIAASVTQINIFVSGIIASQVNGARTWLSVADRFYQLPLGLVGVAIGVALLPALSRAIGLDDKEDAQKTTDQAIVFAMALTLPAAAALLAIPHYLIDGLFQRGEFTAYDATETAKALFHYGWGTPAFVLARVLSPVFFARSDTKAPMRFAIVSMTINIVLGVALFQVIGFEGIAAATAFASWVNVGQMAWTLHRRGDYSPSKAAWGKLVRVLIASLLLGLLLFGAQWLRPMLEAPLAGFRFAGLGPKEITILAVCLVGAALYPALLFLSGGVTVAEAKAALRRRAGTSDAPTPDTL